jgi:8-oxo-dGTP pyrophosphatase MutT (NUDIX family)
MPNEALKREFKEETGLDITVGNMMGSRIEDTADRTKMIVIFEVVCAEGEIKLNYENKEYTWFSKIPENAVYDYGWYINKKRNDS